MADLDLIVDVLQDIFGEWKNHNPNSGQISFDCPTCSFDIKGLEGGDGKGNLEINYRKNTLGSGKPTLLKFSNKELGDDN